MPRQSNGVDIQPANTAAVSGQTISSTAFNTLITDIYTEITNSVDRGGRSSMTAALPMGGQKITGMADPTVATDGANKNYVDTLTGAFFSTGDVKLTLKIVPDAGWLLFDDGTFGSASSGSSNSNNIANLALFTLLFNAPFTDATAPIFTSGGGATTRAAQISASGAWAANCRMSLTKVLGRALAVAGSGAGLTARTPGQTLGEETHVLTANESAVLTYTTNFTVLPTSLFTAASIPNVASTSGTNAMSAATTSTNLTSGGTLQTTANALGNAHNNIQPTTFLNCMVKL